MKSCKRLRSNAGFTLPELMIVIAIIFILSGIGFPAYINYTYTVKQSEIPEVFDKILLAERMYYVEHSALVLVNYAGREPCANNSSYPSRVRCPSTLQDFQNSTLFKQLNIVPTGDLFGQYYVEETTIADGSNGNSDGGGQDNSNSHGGNVGTGNSGNGNGNTGPGNQGNEKPVGNAVGGDSSTVTDISITSVMDLDEDDSISKTYINAHINPLSDSLEKTTDILHDGDSR